MNGTVVLVQRPNGAVISIGSFNAVTAGLSLDVALPDTGKNTPSFITKSSLY